MHGGMAWWASLALTLPLAKVGSSKDGAMKWGCLIKNHPTQM